MEWELVNRSNSWNTSRRRHHGTHFEAHFPPNIWHIDLQTFRIAGRLGRVQDLQLSEINLPRGLDTQCAHDCLEKELPRLCSLLYLSFTNIHVIPAQGKRLPRCSRLVLLDTPAVDWGLGGLCCAIT
jgi:hypothetical protein